MAQQQGTFQLFNLIQTNIFFKQEFWILLLLPPKNKCPPPIFVLFSLIGPWGLLRKVLSFDNKVAKYVQI